MPPLQEARGERVVTPLSIEQALDARDAIAKALYSALFAWLVRSVNATILQAPRQNTSSISVLDIFGFEVFKVSYSQ